MPFLRTLLASNNSVQNVVFFVVPSYCPLKNFLHSFFSALKFFPVDQVAARKLWLVSPGRKRRLEMGPKKAKSQSHGPVSTVQILHFQIGKSNQSQVQLKPIVHGPSSFQLYSIELPLDMGKVPFSIEVEKRWGLWSNSAEDLKWVHEIGGQEMVDEFLTYQARAAQQLLRPIQYLAIKQPRLTVVHSNRKRH